MLVFEALGRIGYRNSLESSMTRDLGLFILPSLGKLGLVKGEANGISLEFGVTQFSVP